MKREPLLTRAGIVAAATALIAVLQAFGFTAWSPEQNTAVMGLVGVVAVIVSALWGRGKVTPVDDPRAADHTPLVKAR